MPPSRLIARPMRMMLASNRGFSTSMTRFNVNDRKNDTQDDHSKHQKDKPLNPHYTNTTPTDGTPKVGVDKAPPELISSVDGNFEPKDKQPEHTERMTGGTQKSVSSSSPEFDVGEIEGGTFKVEPLRRTGEDRNTQIARLLYQSRKRGTLESDLMLSTFADARLDKMTPAQLNQYDLFLDENDWDIYYWVTQEPPSAAESAEQARSVAYPEKDERVQERQGEWAQTIGTFKPAYRPVPARWRNSEILSLLRKHVKDRSAGGVHEVEPAATISGKGLSQSLAGGTGGGGLGFMPPIRNMDV